MTLIVNTALGEHTSSIVSQLVASQKVAQAKMHDHHTQKLRLSEKQQAAAVKMLSGQFRLEKIQLQDKFKQRSAYLTRHTSDPAASETHAPTQLVFGALSH